MDYHQLIQDQERPVVILDVEKNHFVDCNEEATSLFKLSRSELLKRNPFELSPTHVYGHEAKKYALEVIQEALEGSNPVLDWIHTDSEGNEIPCEIRLIRFPPYNKNLVRGTIIDKREESTSFLRESEERLRLTLQSANLGTFDWYPLGDKLLWDKRLFEIFELEPTDQVDLNAYFFSLLHPDDKERVEIEFAKSLQPNGPESNHVEYRVVIAGKTKHILAHSKMIRNEDGEVIRMLVTSQDISELRESAVKLKQSEQRYRNVFNQQFQFTALLDMEGRVIHINDLPLKIQGFKREDYLGKLFWEAPAWEGNKDWQKKIKSQVLFVKKTRELLTVHDPFYGPGKQVNWALASYRVIKDPDETFQNILVQAIDVTAEKKIKQDVEDREHKLSLIYGNTSDFILLIRCDNEAYILEEINESCKKLFDFYGVNLSKEELLGRSMSEIYLNLVKFPEEKWQKRLEAFKSVKSNKKPVSYQHESKTEKGLLITNVELIPVIQQNKVTHLLMVAKDITEAYIGQKRLEEAYREVHKLKAQLEQENIYLKEEIKQANDFENMVFKSKEFRKVLNQVEQVSSTDATVLITGETGTGKELIARAVHNISLRSDRPMIKVNTAAIPRDLIESELFGFEKGAFTGAIGQKPGKFELADGGSIFLDEIGDMPMDLQVKILRVLQEGEVERLGSTTSRKINVRIISATNKDLEQAVKDGTFREDLYFRLKVFPIEIPPLRSRPDDIPILVEHFIAKYNAKHGKSVNSIPKKVMDYLRKYSWPGNIRELENTLERAVILTPGEILELQEVSDDAEDQPIWSHNNSLEVAMENHIRKVLKACDWKIEGTDGAAEQLMIKPSTLRDKMRKLSIKRPK